jgi:mannosyltransferase
LLLHESGVDTKRRTPSFLPRPSLRVIIAVILGLGSTVISFMGSWIPSLWGDEATSVLSATRPIPSLFWMLGRVDAVHGTYYLFLHFWVGAFGASPFSIRFPSAIAAGLTVAGIVLLATRLVNLRTGIFAGIVCLALPRVTYMGEEARGYAFSAALVVWLTILLVKILQDGSPRRRYWVLYAVGLAVCGYVFLFSLLILVAHAVVVLSMRRRTLVVTWAKWAGLGLVLDIPIIAFGYFQRSQIAFLSARNAATFSQVFVGQWFGTAQCAEVCWALIVAAIAVALVSWIRHRNDERTDSRSTPGIVLLGAMWLLAPTAILLTINVVDPIYSSRYLTFAVPGAALLIGYLLGRIKPLALGIVLLVGTLLVTWPVYLSQRTPYSKNASDWAAVAALIKEHAKPGDGMLFDEGINPSKRPRLGMRAYPYAYVGLKDIALKTPWWNTNYWSDSTYTLDQVPERLNGVRTVWLTEYRAPGSATYDQYDLSTLASLKFTVVKTYELHSNVVIELHRP